MMEKKKDHRPTYRKPDFTRPAQRQPVEKKFYDTADMVMLFNVTSRTLQRWRDDGVVPFKKVGGRIYYLASKVDQMMEEEEGTDE